VSEEVTTAQEMRHPMPDLVRDLLRAALPILSAAAAALAASILVGSLIGVSVANSVYNAYPMADKQEESTRRRADSIYEATNWSKKMSMVAVPVVTLLAWWRMSRKADERSPRA
jgi:hypothetical protein